MDNKNNTDSDDLSNFVASELKTLEMQIYELDQQIHDLTSSLEALQIRRKRYDSVRGAYHDVLNRKEIMEGETILPSTPSEPWQFLEKEGVSQASTPLFSSTDGLERGISLSERDYDPSRGSVVRDKGVKIAAAVFEILKDRENLDPEDRPLHYRDLVPEIEKRNIFVSGRDPGLNIIAHIHKDNRFHRPKRGFYGLTEWYPADARKAGERTSRRNSRR